MFHRSAPHLAVEAVQKFGSNVVGFQMETGKGRWYIVGYYLAPNDTLTIKSVVTALKQRPRGAELLVAGDYNVNLAELEGDQRVEDISAAMAAEVLEDMSAHFLLRRRSW